MNIYLIGFMGAGKSSVGELLASNLECEFIDSDRLIEQRVGYSIPEIFDQLGEAEFRSLERAVVQNVTSQRDHVVALGGGATLNDESWHEISNSGVVVYLKAKPQTLYGRLKDQIPSRPLLMHAENPKERIEEILTEREPRYLEASHVIDTEDLAPEEIAAQLIEKLNHEDSRSQPGA